MSLDHARDLAHALLFQLPERWWHTVGVARRAGELAGSVPDDDVDLLVTTAWLHDIGYAAPLVDTGFHPLDGAEYLRRQGWPARLCGLVAHHSGADFVAAARGLSVALSRFGHERSAVADALTYADQTVGPAGRRMTVPDRMTDMIARHGSDASVQAHPLRGPYLMAVAARVERRLSVGPSAR